MKLNFASVALAYIMPIILYGQDSTAVSKTTVTKGQYPNAYTSGSANVSPFANQSKRFNDWSISVGAGTAIMKRGSLYSIHGEDGSKNLFGWAAYLSVDKGISHAFGLKLQFDKGETIRRLGKYERSYRWIRREDSIWCYFNFRRC